MMFDVKWHHQIRWNLISPYRFPLGKYNKHPSVSWPNFAWYNGCSNNGTRVCQGYHLAQSEPLTINCTRLHKGSRQSAIPELLREHRVDQQGVISIFKGR
jgi:hypothetical protein